ncbi:hypothetical protein [Hymenobacter terricola]|uniref:hypothetical protein n=1 Tax=Hymenobacter terricola TaxID=2819236 RepID=UPI001B305A20|nr:hypothetical protein [Hymenobacter terricola]
MNTARPCPHHSLALYLEWVAEADYAQDLKDDHDIRFGWQKHADLKAALGPAPYVPPQSLVHRGIPNWYRFHNARTGHDHLLHLPDLRGAKEERYLQVLRDIRAQQDAEAGPQPAPDQRPAQLTDVELPIQLAEFARRYEPARINRWREAFEAAHPTLSAEEQELNTIIHFAQVLDEPLAIEADADWRFALRRAYYHFRKQKRLAALPVVHEAYVQRQECGISHPSRHSIKHYDLAFLTRSSILDARKRLGEPLDFDF